MIEEKCSINITINKSLYDEICSTAENENRSKVKQIVHWIKLGQLLDKHPEVMPVLKLREQLQ